MPQLTSALANLPYLARSGRDFPLFSVAASQGESAAYAVLLQPAEGESNTPAVLSGTDEVNELFDIDLSSQLASEKVSGKAGEVFTLTRQVRRGQQTDAVTPAPLLYAVGIGDADTTALRRAGAALGRASKSRESLQLWWPTELDIPPFWEGFALAAYTPPAQKKDKQGSADDPQPIDPHAATYVRVVIDHPDATHALEQATTFARAAWLARDLANLDPTRCSPPQLADYAVQVAQTCGLTAHVWDSDQLAAEGFGGLLAVGSANESDRGPRLVMLSYDPPQATQHVVLVGKGITFDSGGLSLKPRESMPSMKTDMSGAATVLAAIAAAAAREIPNKVTALLACAENLPGAAAYRPSDVVRCYGGTTVEVINTDAEGRMVLADALAYADAQLNPDVLVDVATLTGAATLGLGKRHAAMFTDDDQLADQLRAAAEVSGEQVWRMPMWAEDRASLDSEVADLAHVSLDHNVPAGASTAALFLKEFVGSRRWVHLDIAGPGRADGDEHEVTKGGTGFGVRLLTCWLTNGCGNWG